MYDNLNKLSVILSRIRNVSKITIMKFLLWLILLVMCWPIAILMVFLYPIIWLVLLPFRILGFAVDGVIAFIKALFLLPARILS
jgi:hypothetical protein